MQEVIHTFIAYLVVWSCGLAKWPTPRKRIWADQVGGIDLSEKARLIKCRVKNKKEREKIIQAVEKKKN